MDRAHLYIKETIDFYPSAEGSLDGLIRRYREMVGFDWIGAKENPWDYSGVEFPEFETRSALEFIRPELTEYQLLVLNEIDSIYKEWITEGIFYERYREAWGDRFTWQGERNDIAEELGRSIPKSHWWLWPPEEA